MHWNARVCYRSCSRYPKTSKTPAPKHSLYDSAFTWPFSCWKGRCEESLKPIPSICMVYLPTFTIQINQMWVQHTIHGSYGYNKRSSWVEHLEMCVCVCCFVVMPALRWLLCVSLDFQCCFAHMLVYIAASLLDTRIGPVFSRIPGNTNPSDTANKTELTWTNHDKFTISLEVFEWYVYSWKLKNTCTSFCKVQLQLQ